MSKADKVVISLFVLGTVVIVAIDDGTRFLDGLLGSLALVLPFGFGLSLSSIGFEARSKRVRGVAFVLGLAFVVGAWAVERNASMANDAFVQVAEGVPPNAIPFLRDVEPGRQVLRGAAANATYLREPKGAARSLVWSDWVGNSYLVTLDVESGEVVSTLNTEFQRGVIGARYLVVVAAGFLTGLVVVPSYRYFARNRLSRVAKGV
jgi:hypothetical protein